MEQTAPFRAELIRACQLLIRDFNDFWLLSAITDYSFEEGDRSGHFKKVIASYLAAGAPAPLLLQMQKGINGNLADILATRGVVTRNKWEGQDLLLAREDGAEARVEVKQVFDCTVPKYYHSVAADMRNLRDVHQRGFTGALFLAVFFVQLPDFRYARHLGRRRVICGGIVRQYQRVSEAVSMAPFWPLDRPDTISLKLPQDEEMRTTLETRFRSVHGPAASVERSLEDAAVGVSLWEYRLASSAAIPSLKDG